VKKLFSAIIVGTMIFGAVMASAAALNVNADTIQVGTNSNSLTCDSDGVHVAWLFDQHGLVTSVQVTGVNGTACAGQNLYVFSLASGGAVNGAPHFPSVDCGAPGDVLSYAPAPIVAGTNSYKIAMLNTDDGLSGPFTCGVSGASIEGVRVIIGV
jgi:hypothetical protein